MSLDQSIKERYFQNKRFVFKQAKFQVYGQFI